MPTVSTLYEIGEVTSSSNVEKTVLRMLTVCIAFSIEPPSVILIVVSAKITLAQSHLHHFEGVQREFLGSLSTVIHRLVSSNYRQGLKMFPVPRHELPPFHTVNQALNND
uniref:CSON006523 protein n=1 Tax=Culicoides sonorensis TaxID=179676 RepID=A0A336M8F8_CULSO